ncbi:hypothetical protein BD779DRAFT_1809388 [Infundibulicybe gibba]|nr:hypothetical protein BD779DRAFT_1809388 [Infundibulicybe gibba]
MKLPSCMPIPQGKVSRHWKNHRSNRETRRGRDRRPQNASLPSYISRKWPARCHSLMLSYTQYSHPTCSRNPKYMRLVSYTTPKRSSHYPSTIANLLVLDQTASLPSPNVRRWSKRRTPTDIHAAYISRGRRRNLAPSNAFWRRIATGVGCPFGICTPRMASPGGVCAINSPANTQTQERGAPILLVRAQREDRRLCKYFHLATRTIFSERKENRKSKLPGDLRADGE